MNYARLFHSKNVMLSLESTDKDEALKEMVDFLRNEEVFDEKTATAALKALREREKLGSTGIGNGVAIPHAKSKTVGDMVVAVAHAPKGLDYQSVDGEPVHILFLVVSRPEEAEEHLEVLRWISKLVRNRDFCMFFQRATTVEEVQGLLKEMGDG